MPGCLRVPDSEVGLLAKEDVDKSSLCPSCVHVMAESH